MTLDVDIVPSRGLQAAFHAARGDSELAGEDTSQTAYVVPGESSGACTACLASLAVDMSATLPQSL